MSEATKYFELAQRTIANKSSWTSQVQCAVFGIILESQYVQLASELYVANNVAIVDRKLLSQALAYGSF